jgi:glutamine synthetase
LKNGDPTQPTTEVLDRGGYFDLTTRDAAIEWRRETVVQLEKWASAWNTPITK